MLCFLSCFVVNDDMASHAGQSIWDIFTCISGRTSMSCDQTRILFEEYTFEASEIHLKCTFENYYTEKTRARRPDTEYGNQKKSRRNPHASISIDNNPLLHRTLP